MSEDEVGFTILGVIFAMAILAAIVAAVKKRSAFGWFIGTLMFPPLLLLILLLPSSRGDKTSKSNKPNMPSWTQPPPVERSYDSSEDLQSALEQAEAKTDSEVGKRILAMAARAAARAEQRQRRTPRPRRERARPQREAGERQAEPPASVTRTSSEQAQMREAAGDANVRQVSSRARQPRRGAVQRRGSRETVIYRRG